jgi:hypothetical protein
MKKEGADFLTFRSADFTPIVNFDAQAGTTDSGIF